MPPPATPALPEPPPEALAHSARLVARIEERIAAEGPLPFVEYMRLALYEPGLGYYAAGSAKLGTAGDFVTAPELTAVFGRCVAVQCAEVLDAIGADGGEDVAGQPREPPGILELGAGSGRLALSLLEALGPVPYTILEPSADLAERQRRLLAARLAPESFAALSWVTALPRGFRGMILANEVMDALPVERFVRARDGVLQARVARAAGGGFEDALAEAPVALAEAVGHIERDLGAALPEGYAGELCPTLGAWVGALAESLERGVVLLADYGYPRRELYLPERRDGTLVCHYRHRAHDDPYLWPGLQDITAHVDFTRVAEAAVAADLDLLGHATQAAFLLGCDFAVLAEAALAACESEAERVALAGALGTLTLPGAMGERFRFVALGRGHGRALRGFALQDLTHRL